MESPRLTESEWAIVVEILEQERDELHTVIHHTDSLEAREELRERLKSVEAMLERLSAPLELPNSSRTPAPRSTSRTASAKPSSGWPSG